MIHVARKYFFSKEEIEKAYAGTGSIEKAATLLGMNRKTFKEFCKKYEVQYNNQASEHGKRVIKAYMANEPTIQNAMDMLHREGYFVTKDPQLQDYHFDTNIKPFEGETYKIGIVSDMQLGSRYQQLTHLRTFYKYCQEKNIRDILCCGDLTDGQKMYKGHEFELFLHGADAQIDYCEERYPEYPDVTTHFICGNHDESHYKLARIDVGLHISKERRDMKYLGFHGAYLNIGGAVIYLHHASGGVAYARSYKMQRLIEQMAPEKKPDMLFDGHYHVSSHLPMYRNVYAWQLPCFQSQTPYLVAKGLYPEIMGLIVEFTIYDGQPSKYKVEELPFYVPKKDDF